MANRAKPTAAVEDPAAVSVERHVALEMERGSVSVSRDGLAFSVSGKNVKLRKQSPLNLSFETGRVEFNDGAIRVEAEGDSIHLELD